jgi:hypothetical protein
MMRIQRLLTVVAVFGVLGTFGSRLNAQAASTMCKDGTTSASSGRGACSGHGGVDTKATAAAKKAAKAEAKTEKKTEAKSEAKTERAEKSVAQVTCSDGTMSKPGRGACSGHGGVRNSANATAAPRLPAPVPSTSPARTSSEAKSKAPTATNPSSKRGEDSDPTGAIAQCKDGLYSHAANRRGACSRHGGVSKWLKEP